MSCISKTIALSTYSITSCRKAELLM